MSKKTLVALAIAACALPALAQTNSTSTGTGTGQAAVGNVTSSTDLTFNSAPVPAATTNTQLVGGGTHNTVENNGSATVKTTGQAFAPAMAVSSGGFNCTGTNGLGIGGTGFAVSGGMSKEMPGCLALNAAVLYGQKGDAEMFENIMCEIPAVAAARKKKGFDCETLAPMAGYKAGTTYGTAVRMTNTELAEAGLPVPAGPTRVSASPTAGGTVVASQPTTYYNTTDADIRRRLAP